LCAALPKREAQAANTGDGGQLVVESAPVSLSRDARVTQVADYRFVAGWRSDPFFCDVEGTKNGLRFTRDDFFADKNVCSIALEVPNSAFGSKKVRIWARTLVRQLAGRGGKVQVDRGALPAQTNVLTGDENDAYITGAPVDDARFLTIFAHSLERMGGYSPQEAKRVAGTLLPDILPYDPFRPASFPVNGRTLTEDVFDSFLAVLTNGSITEDKVGPHNDLIAEFPYLGSPHKARDESREENQGKTKLKQNDGRQK
jgi:Domain of unknown function (DUF4331)